MKKFRKIALRLALLFIAYIAIGAFAPFLRTPEMTISPEIADQVAQIQSSDASVDRVAILESNTDALDERLRLIHQAQEEIILTCYDIRDGESTRDVLAAILRKADTGVHVRILADGLSALAHMNGEYFAAISNHPFIEIRQYNAPNLLTPWTLMGRMHDKYLIIDDLAYILGGRNQFDYFVGDYPTEHRSLDREALVYNSAAGTPDSRESSLFQLRDYFEKMWAMDETVPIDYPTLKPSAFNDVCAELTERYVALSAARPELFTPADYTSFTSATEGVSLIANPTHPYAKDPTVFETLTSLMQQAQKDVIIHSPYAVLNSDMTNALSAISENVPTTLMINARENGDNIVASSDYTYHRSGILKTGVQLLEYAGGDSYHGKSIAIDDDIAIIGSFNLDLRSTYVDTELMLVIKSTAVNRQLRQNMTALHEKCLTLAPNQAPTCPEGLTLPSASIFKKVIWPTLGLLLQPIRILV